MNSSKLVVSPSPHIHSGNLVSKIMLDFLVALIPTAAFGVYIFGLGALRVMLIAVISAVAWEALIQKATKRPLTTSDLSAVVSALILALILPPTIPWWLILVATLIMIVLGREVYGGYGNNPFNPVLVAWVVLQMSFPDFMTSWIVPGASPELAPMEVLKQQGPSFAKESFTYSQLLLGQTAGFTGQVSALMLLIGGAFLLWRKAVNWRIPVCYLAGVFLFSGLFWIFSPSSFADPVFHVLAGGTLIAAFFLATDLPSSPVTPEGMVYFGLGAGVLTAIIRMWGAWPFGAFYAVFIMNLATPFLDKTAPEVYGR